MENERESETTMKTNAAAARVPLERPPDETATATTAVQMFTIFSGLVFLKQWENVLEPTVTAVDSHRGWNFLENNEKPKTQDFYLDV